MSRAWHPPGYNSRRWRQLRAAILLRDGGRCWICGRNGADSVDHIQPRSRGGTDDPANLRAAHLACNVSRGDRVTVPQGGRKW